MYQSKTACDLIVDIMQLMMKVVTMEYIINNIKIFLCTNHINLDTKDNLLCRLTNRSINEIENNIAIASITVCIMTAFAVNIYL